MVYGAPFGSGGVIAEVNRLVGIAGIYGTAGNDLIRGSSRTFEYYCPGAGNDTVDGRGGADVVDYGPASRGITVLLARVGAATIVSDDGYGLVGGVDTLLNIEAIYGTNFADTITGNEADNRLRGRAGNDTLDGAPGSTCPTTAALGAG